MKVTSKRVVLGGAMHGQTVTVLHGSTMQYAPSGDIYKRYGNLWWVPVDDDQTASEKRIVEWKSSYRL